MAKRVLFGKLRDVTDCRIEQMGTVMPHHEHDECHYGHRQGNAQVKADFQLQGFRAHRLLYRVSILVKNSKELVAALRMHRLAGRLFHINPL